MAVAVRYPQLRDEDWLRRRLELGHNTISIAAELGCSDPLVSKALRQFGLKPPRTAAAPHLPLVEPKPEPELRTLQERLVGLAVDEGVPDAELRARACEGLGHLVTLMEISERAGQRGLWDAVVEALEPGEARAIAYAAALVAAEQYEDGAS